jgi:hypothetical protein
MAQAGLKLYNSQSFCLSLLSTGINNYNFLIYN